MVYNLTQEWAVLRVRQIEEPPDAFQSSTQEQVVRFPKSARCLTRFSLSSGLGAHHQARPQRSGAESPDCPKQSLPGVRVVRGSIHLKSWLQSESLWILKPACVVLKGSSLGFCCEHATTSAQPSGAHCRGPRKRRLPVHCSYFLAGAVVIRLGRIPIRFGRRSSSNARPTSSDLALASSFSLSIIPSAKRTAA